MAKINKIILDGLEYEIEDSKAQEKLIELESDSSVTDLMTEIFWSELKNLRDNSELVPGMKYRITDYNTTTSQADTASANHQFDVIVEALTENTLNESASACLHEGDTYFASSKLHAWKLWYSLDNDTTRFAWADTVNGKGVIYRMIDEWNNDVFYDFKNILTINQQVDGNFVTSNSSKNFGRCLENLIDLYNNTEENELLKYSARPSKVVDGIMSSNMYCAANYISVGVLEDKKLYYTFSYNTESDLNLNGETVKVKQDYSLTGRVYSNIIKCEVVGAWTLPRIRCLAISGNPHIGNNIIRGYQYWDINICGKSNIFRNEIVNCHHIYVFGNYRDNKLRLCYNIYASFYRSDMDLTFNVFQKATTEDTNSLQLKLFGTSHFALGKKCDQITFKDSNNYVSIGDYCDNIILEQNSSELWLGDYCSTIHLGINVDAFRIYSDTTKQRPINYVENVTVENAIYDGTYPTFVYDDSELSEENKLRGIMIDGAAYKMVDISSITPGNNYTTKVSKGVNGEVIIWREADTVQKIGDINTALENIING